MYAGVPTRPVVADAAVGELFALARKGIFSYDSDTGTAWTQGVTALYYDVSADKLTADSTLGAFVGYASQDKASAATSGEVLLMTAFADDRPRPEIVSVGAADGDTVAVVLKAVDAAGNDVAEAVPFRWWLSSSATTGAVSGTTPDGDVTYTTGLEIAEHTTDLVADAVTDVNGDAELSVDHSAGAVDYYLWITMGGVTVVSSKLEIT